MSVSADKPTVALIIDDEVQIRRLLRLTLEAHGYKVYEAADGQTGLLETGQRRPDVVLLDLGLPDPDGGAQRTRSRGRQNCRTGPWRG